MLLFQRVLRGLHGGFVELAHELADVLHLPALALEVGDALGFFERIDELFGQLQALERSRQEQELLLGLGELGLHGLGLGEQPVHVHVGQVETAVGCRHDGSFQCCSKRGLTPRGAMSSWAQWGW